MLRHIAVTAALALVVTGVSAAPGMASPPPSDGEDLLAVYTGTVDAEDFAAIIDLGVDRRDIVVTPSRRGTGRSRRRSDPQRRPGGAVGRDRRRTRAEAAGAAPRAAGAGDRLPPLPRRGRPAGGTRAAGGGASSDRRTHGDRPDRQRHRHHRSAGDEEPVEGEGRQAAGHRVRRSAACARVDHAGDGPSAARRRAERLRHRPADHEAREHDRDVVHPRRQPRRLRLHVRGRQRLWRKNLADNNGDGEITTGDGVDLNRNFPTRWGYDNEGSSPNPASETYRGTGAGIRARDQGPRCTVREDHAGVPRQLPLGRGAAAARHRLAGRDALARRRDLRGDGGRRREPRRAGL